MVGSRSGLGLSWCSFRSSTVRNNLVYWVVTGFLVRFFLLRRILNSQLSGTLIDCTHSGLYRSSISQLFNIEILKTDFLTKFWRYYLQSLQRLSTRVCKYFRPKVCKDFQNVEIGGYNYTYFAI